MWDWTGIPQLIEAHRSFGVLRFWLLLAATVGAILALAVPQIWLSERIGWRENYGFRCSRRCLIEDLWHSPKLLAGGSIDELALFAMIWLLPVTVIGALLWTLVKRQRQRSRAGILPMERD